MGGGSGSGSGAMIPHARGAQVAPLHETSRSSSSSKESPNSLTPHAPPGLKNVGNTCFANAALQCLLSTPLSHALLDPKTVVIFRSYSSNLKILNQGSGEVDTDESSDDEDDIFDDPDPFLASSTGNDNGGANQVRSSQYTEERRRRREERQKRREERRKQREKRDMIEKCGWVTRELKVITQEYTRGPPSTDSAEESKSSGFAGGFFSSWSYSPPPPPNPVVDPGQITRHVNKLSRCLRPYQQEDAHEFLRALLSTLIMDGHNKELSSLFDGLLESAVTCKTCRRASLTRDRYMDLSLDINHEKISSLPEALKAFTATEILDGDNMVNCDRCGVKREVTKGLRLATAPTVLVCHLKRFAYDMYGRTVRLAKHVEFPLRLTIGDFMSKANRSTPPPYELVGVLVHTGRSCDSGHYVSFVKSGQSWYKCNDAIVTKVPVEKVLEQRAYILMYEVAGMREKHGFKSFHRYHEGPKTTIDSIPPTRPPNRSGDPLSWTAHKTSHHSPTGDPLSWTTHKTSHHNSGGDPLSWTTHKTSQNNHLASGDGSFDAYQFARSQSFTKANHTPMISDEKDMDTMSDSGSTGGRHRIGDEREVPRGHFSEFFSSFCSGDLLDNICSSSFSGNSNSEETNVKECHSVNPIVCSDTNGENSEQKSENKNMTEGNEEVEKDMSVFPDESLLSTRTAMTRSISSGRCFEVEKEAAEAYQSPPGTTISGNGDNVNEAKSSKPWSRSRSKTRTFTRTGVSKSLTRMNDRSRTDVDVVPSRVSGRRSFSKSTASFLQKSRSTSKKDQLAGKNEDASVSSLGLASSAVSTGDQENKTVSSIPMDKALSSQRSNCLPPLHRKNKVNHPRVNSPPSPLLS